MIRRLLFAVLLGAPVSLGAQDRGAASLHELVRGLGTTVRVLMIGAHPDDEDTQLLTWLARGRQVETAYLSLTRGDGGQNLIGNELGEALGVIRTEELLAARRIDGAHQYFTRAYDFGFSKSAEETYTHWPKDTLLRDVVTIVRAFRPHVIVAVFSGTPRDGHGHHQVSGLLAREAYDVAGDSVRFPARATGGLAPWAPQKLYRRAFGPQGNAPDSLTTLRINVGEYNPVLGRSYAEIAGESRSQHLSQGFGSLQPKGVRWATLRREATRASGAPADAKAERDLFDGIDTTWGRFAGVKRGRTPQLDSLPAAIAAVQAVSDFGDPSRMVPALARVVKLAVAASFLTCRGEGLCMAPCGRDLSNCDAATRDLASTATTVQERASRALQNSAGLSVEAVTSRELVALGDSVPVRVEFHNRGRLPVRVLATILRSRGDTPPWGRTDSVNRAVAPDSAIAIQSHLQGYSLSVPWWRRQPRPGDMFALDTAREMGNGVRSWEPAPEMLSGEDRVAHTEASALVEIDGKLILVQGGPVVYRYADPARGEVRRPVAVVPPIGVLLERDVEYVPAGKPVQRQVRVRLRSALGTPWQGRVRLVLPKGLAADSASRGVTVPAGGETDASFLVQGRVATGQHRIDAVAYTDSSGAATATYAQGYVPIEYAHIRPQRFYRPASTVVSSVDVNVPEGTRVAYVPGVGDNVAPMLRQLGIPTVVLDADTLATADLSRFTTLVVGPRAYEAHPALRASASRVLDFARRGGTVVVQYGQYEMTQPGVMPYPITLGRPADRVTEEGAAVRVLDPSSPLLAGPNRIAAEDWSGWVQERSLYMPRTFDERYAALVAMHDAGEPEQRGGILVAPVGKGLYVYTTLSFFRQLPSGVPGPARLFVNLLAAGPRGESAGTP